MRAAVKLGRLYDHRELGAGGEYFERVKGEFECPLLGVEVCEIDAGEALEFTADLGWTRDALRLFVALDDVLLATVDGDEVTLRPGEQWYLDCTDGVSLRTESGEAGSFIEFDLGQNAWLRSTFPSERHRVRAKSRAQRAGQRTLDLVDVIRESAPVRGTKRLLKRILRRLD